MVKKFKSRYGDERILTTLKDGRYRVEGRTNFTRHGDGLFDVKHLPIIEKVEIDQNVVDKGYAAVILHTRKA
jgi:hypothetical protein